MSPDRIRLPFAEQIAFLRDKLNLPTERWTDIERAAHDRAFVVAGAMQADLLDDLRDAVDKAVAGDSTLADFRRDFRQIIERRGWTDFTGDDRATQGPQGGRGLAWRTRTIYQTNIASSYAAGRWRQLNDPALLAERPYWRYVHSDFVANPRPQHKAWGDSRLTLRHDHPFWKTHFPPNGWGCKCTVRAVRAPGQGDDTAPPAGWDTRDTKGRPPGVDTGWDYAPGASLICVDALAARGPRYCADTQMLDGLLAKLPRKSPIIGAQMVDAWPPQIFEIMALRFADIVRIQTATRRPQGRHHFVGAMKPGWVTRAQAAGAKIVSAELIVRDRDIGHTLRPEKAMAGKMVDPQWYGRLPVHLRTPGAVLLRITPKQEMLLVYDSGVDKQKIVALLDYAGSGLNVVRTAGRLIETDSLRAQVNRGEMLVLEGSL